jgi:hypothetical protein
MTSRIAPLGGAPTSPDVGMSTAEGSWVGDKMRKMGLQITLAAASQCPLLRLILFCGIIQQ